MMLPLNAFENRLLSSFLETGGRRLDWAVDDVAVTERTVTGVGFVTGLCRKTGATGGMPSGMPLTLLLSHHRLPHDAMATLWLDSNNFPESMEVASFDAIDWPSGQEEDVSIAEAAVVSKPGLEK